MTKSKKKHDTSHDGITQIPWLYTSLERIQTQDPDAVLFETFQHDGTIIHHTRQKIAEIVSNLTHVLIQLEVRPEQRIAIDADISWEICAIWLAAITIGAVPVFYPTDMRFRDKRTDLEQDVGDQQGPLTIITEYPDQAKLWLEASGLPTPHIICLRNQTKDNRTLEQIFDNDIPEQINRFADYINKTSEPVSPVKVPENDPVAYVYTQGSHSSTARRIIISHNHLLAQAEDLQTKFIIDQNSKLYIDLISPHAVTLSIIATSIFTGATVLIPESDVQPLEVHKNIHSITHAFLLPDSIQSILNDIQMPSHKRFRDFFFKLAKHRNRYTQSWHKWPNECIKRLLINPFNNKYFPSLKSLISYGNHFDTKAAECISWLDIKVYNAFTLGELGFVHIHAFNGTGGFLKSIEARIKSGILSVKSSRFNGPFIQTEDLVFEDERSGLCAHRSSTITTDSEELIDTSPMRDILKRNIFIDEIYIHGNNRPFLTALIYINEKAMMEWAESNHLTDTTFEALTQNEQFYTFIRSIVDNCNNTRSAKESIQKIALLNRPIDKDPHIVSPCGLTRFKEIEHRYRAILDSFYQNNF